MFGLHPNAEIGYLTSLCDSLFATVAEVAGGSSEGSSGGSEEHSKTILADFQKRTPENFKMLILNERAAEMTPHMVVCL